MVPEIVEHLLGRVIERPKRGMRPLGGFDDLARLVGPGWVLPDAVVRAACEGGLKAETRDGLSEAGSAFS